MPAVRRWLVPLLAGSAGGLLLSLYWQHAERFAAGCTDCILPVGAIAWAIGALLFPAVATAIMTAAGRGGPRIALQGTLLLYLGLLIYLSLRYGTPRPPTLLLIVAAVLSLLIAAATQLTGRPMRWAGAALVLLLLAGAGVSVATAGHRDRLHQYTALAGIARIPDPARWRVVSAHAYLGYQAIELRVGPAGGGAELELVERPAAISSWDPPGRCGPRLTELRAALLFGREVPGPEPCLPYAGGGWQRTQPAGGPELIDLEGATIVAVDALDPDRTAPPATLRDLLTALQPATPSRMAALPV